MIANEIELRRAISTIGDLGTLEERRQAAKELAPELDAFLAEFADDPDYCDAWRYELDASVED